MKNRLIGCSALILSLAAGSVVAQTTDTQVRSAQELLGAVQDIQRSKGDAMSIRPQLEKATYLGIATTPVSPALREQLKLKASVGLVVERVESGSPAEQAGVKQYDIVEKFDDQILMNTEQFTSLVRMHEPGATIRLSVIRQGQPQTVTATLIEKEMPVPRKSTNLLWNEPNGALFIQTPEAAAPRLTITSSPKATSVRPMTITSVVGQNAITLTRNGDSTRLSAKDTSGNSLFDGPVDTEEQWADVPPDVAREARRLMSSLDLKFPFPVNGVSGSPVIVQPAAPAAPVAPTTPALP